MKEDKSKREALEERLKKITIFPGTISDYEKLVGFEVGIIDTKTKDKGIYFNDKSPYEFYLLNQEIRYENRIEFYEYLLGQGIEAIVNAQSTDKYRGGVYGLPVRHTRKKI